MHILDRLKERYGLVATEADILAARDRIKAGDCFITTTSHQDGYGRCMLRINGVAVHVAYSLRSGMPVTALPPNSTGSKKKAKRTLHGPSRRHAPSHRKREGSRPEPQFDARDWR